MLGCFEVSVGARAVEESQWRLKKASSLVKALALAPRHRLSREQAMDLFWPKLDPDAAANNLRYALHVARRTLDSASATAASRYLRFQDGVLALYPSGPLWVDVVTFEEAAAAASGSRDPVAYEEAAELYAGELLPQDRYEAWVEDRQTSLRRTYLALLLELAEMHEECGDFESATETLCQPR
jgi:DNA-binding SARP family transcriptional activator